VVFGNSWLVSLGQRATRVKVICGQHLHGRDAQLCAQAATGAATMFLREVMGKRPWFLQALARERQRLEEAQIDGRFRKMHRAFTK